MNAVYARQSLDKKDSISIETQIELCKNEAGDAQVKTYIDKGFSGKNTNRPQFKAMMEDVRHGLIDKVIVYKLDRLSRSLLDFAGMIDEFSKNKVEFLSTREKFDTSTPIGNAMLSIIMVFAQLERETIQIRVQDNYYARSSHGSYDCIAPYGYEKCRRLLNGKHVSTLEINDETVATVRRIFDEYAYTSTSLGYLAKRLNKEGVPSPAGVEWDSCKLSRIMANPVYVKADAEVYRYYSSSGIKITNGVDDFIGQNGCVTYGKWDHSRRKFDQLSSLQLSIGLHEGIISADTFLKCQYRLSANSQISNASRGKHSWLTGLIKCGYCGRAMKVLCSHKPGAMPKFMCSGATNYGMCHESPKAAVADVEAAVEGEIMSHVEKRRDLQYKIEEEESVRDRQYKIDITKLDEQIAKLLDAVANGNAASVKYINDRITQLDAKKTALIQEQQEYRLSYATKEAVAQFEDILTMWGSMSNEQRHDVAYMFIKEIQVFHDKVNISWKYKF